MTGQDELDRVGRGELDDVDECDALLDRLGRREPGHADLDDRVAASLALLAEDVDLEPVPVEVTREALALADTWPLSDQCVGPDQELRAATRPDTTIILPRAPVEGTTPVSPAPAFIRRGGDRRGGDRRGGDRRGGDRRGGDRRPPPRTDVPRVMRMRVRSPLGVIAAGMLVMAGGLSALVTTGDTVNPLGRFSSVMLHWGGGHSPATSRHDELSAKIEAARVLLDQGRVTQARLILTDVHSHLFDLEPTERDDLSAAVAVIESQLQEVATSQTASGVVGNHAVARATGGPGAASPVSSASTPGAASSNADRDAKADRATDVKVKSKPDVKVKPKPDVKVKSKPDVKVKPKPDVKVKPKPDVKVKPKPDVKVKPKPDVKVKPKAKATADPTVPTGSPTAS